MNTQIIHETAAQVLAGTMSFPEVVRTLTAAGVEAYHVDYVSLRKTYYGADGSTAATALSFETLPPVAENFDAVALRAAIADSQQKGQKYREFTHRAMNAGVQGYIAFLRGQRVTYWGRQGDQHIEWFPGAERRRT
jgi:uncharacterized protein YbcV (DUF1398 family)